MKQIIKFYLLGGHTHSFETESFDNYKKIISIMKEPGDSFLCIDNQEKKNCRVLIAKNKIVSVSTESLSE